MYCIPKISGFTSHSHLYLSALLYIESSLLYSFPLNHTPKTTVEWSFQLFTNILLCYPTTCEEGFSSTECDPYARWLEFNCDNLLNRIDLNGKYFQNISFIRKRQQQQNFHINFYQTKDSDKFSFFSYNVFPKRVVREKQHRTLSSPFQFRKKVTKFILYVVDCFSIPWIFKIDILLKNVFYVSQF